MPPCVRPSVTQYIILAGAAQLRWHTGVGHVLGVGCWNIVQVRMLHRTGFFVAVTSPYCCDSRFW